MKREIIINVNESNIRVDKLITAELEGFSRSAVQNLFLSGAVTCNGEQVQKNAKLSIGDELHLVLPANQELKAAPEAIPLEILYEDNDLLVVNKPKGLVVHPAPGNPTGTLVNALLYHCRDSLSGINGVLRPGIVHRIDKDTSGLLMVAKNDFAHAALAQQIQEHSFQREYQCVVYGEPKEESGRISAPIGRNPKERKKMAVIPSGKNAKEAVTHYRVLDYYRDFTHLSVRLETGRTHQIRVHMAYIGHPIAGDAVYGPKKVITPLGGQCLHAGKLGFLHPRTKAFMTFKAPLPDYFITFLAKLTPR